MESGERAQVRRNFVIHRAGTRLLEIGRKFDAAARMSVCLLAAYSAVMGLDRTMWYKILKITGPKSRP